MLQQEQVNTALEYCKTNAFSKFITDSKFFNAYIMTIKLLRFENNIAIFVVSDQFAKDEITKKYLNYFSACLFTRIKTNIAYYFVTAQETDIDYNGPYNYLLGDTNLIDNLTFETYVEGVCNRVTFKAAKDIASGRAMNSFNLLFISGGVGVGKTHLMNAIGIEYYCNNPNKKIKFYTTDDMIRKISPLYSDSAALENFKDEIIGLDMLLIDDIQFFAKKEKTSEVFFNMFNKMNQLKKIIIVTSDRSIEQLRSAEGIDARVISRLGSQMIGNILTPDITTLKSIIIRKISESPSHFKVTSEAVDYLANRSYDIRSIIGNIMRINFYFNATFQPNEVITVQDIQKILSDSDDNNQKLFGNRYNFMAIIEKICTEYNIEVDLVISTTRISNIVNIRDICMYALRKKCGAKFEQIGSYFSNRSHSTVMEAIERVEKKFKVNKNYKGEIDRLISKL